MPLNHNGERPLDPSLDGHRFPGAGRRVRALPEFSLEFRTAEGASSPTLRAVRMASPLSVSWSLDGESGVYCDCHDLLAAYRDFHLHIFKDPVRERFSEVPQEQAIAQIRDWQDKMIFFANRAVPVPETGEPLRAVYGVISQGFIPMPDRAVFSTGDPGLIRLLKRLNAEQAEHFERGGGEFILGWDTLIELARSDRLALEWIAAERESTLGPVAPQVDPLAVDISGLDPAEVFAAFYNNAPSPAGSGPVRVGQAVADTWAETLSPPISSEVFEEANREITSAMARKILEEEASHNFSYYQGARRMKLFLGEDPSQPNKRIRTESFDLCAFDGAGRFLIERLRATGKVSRCLEYSAALDGRLTARVVED